MNKPDHYSVLTVVLSFSLGALSSLNTVAESYPPQYRQHRLKFDELGEFGAMVFTINPFNSYGGLI